MADMYCRQCEQTAKGIACTVSGVCGKDPQTAALQDALIHMLKGIGACAHRARAEGKKDSSIDDFIIKALFTTITNVNFDPADIEDWIRQGQKVREKAKGLCKDPSDMPSVVSWEPSEDLETLIAQAASISIENRKVDMDIRSLREILLYGLKGMAAYADHAGILGKRDEEVDAFFPKALDAIEDDSLSADDYVSLIMDFGRVNLRCMQILDEGHTESFGHPVPTNVTLGTKKGPAIIVSGHDLPDLAMLLEQTKGQGVNIYTHGEMLSAHGYPELKKHAHLAGHFGTAWQNQQKEFDGVPATFLFTTNCIQKPAPTYVDNVFTTGLVEYPGVEKIESQSGKKDFGPIIERAKSLGGFDADDVEKEILVGFAHDTVLGLADQIIDAVKDKSIRHFFLIGGCDGAKPGRNYYTELAEQVPDDCIILTLACGKFRLNRLDLGSIGAFPRLLDCGQCNDAYSAIKIAQALADAFDTDVNGLPLSIVLSWYEQKAVCILLSLFSLGVRDIRLGPSLPSFISPNVLGVLVDKFGIKPISTPEEDLAAMLE